VAEGARLESVCAACRTPGSNPGLSVLFWASISKRVRQKVLQIIYELDGPMEDKNTYAALII
jgi:hypothetical protein